MKLIRLSTGLISLLLTSLLNITFAHAQLIDEQKRHTLDERLMVIGDGAMGDRIDPHIGSLIFQHTDVSIPGNSGLEVALRRRLRQGKKYEDWEKVEFGDWELDVPKISAIASKQHGWAGNRCSGSWADNFPEAQNSNGDTVSSSRYSDGVTVNVPGQGTQRLLKNPSAQFHTSAVAGTATDWYFACDSDPASDGGQAFVGLAPNGDKYFFGKVITRDYNDLEFDQTTYLDRVEVTLMATAVVDVHGNWVHYNYGGERLFSIDSNDGREISFEYYQPNNDQLITKVSANGRDWSYEYTYDGATNTQSLSKVTQPDGLFWDLDMVGMLAKPVAPTYGTCSAPDKTVTITNPTGNTGTYTLSEVRHRQAYKLLHHVKDCGAGPKRQEIFSTRVMAVASKNISGSTWSFDYEQDAVCGILGVPCNNSAVGLSEEDSPSTTYLANNNAPYYSDQVYGSHDPIDFTNWTSVTLPDGSHDVYFHHWDVESIFGGRMIRKDKEKPNYTLLDKSDMVLVQPGFYGDSSVFLGLSSGRPAFPHKSTMTRNGKYFIKDFAYNLDLHAADYSFGRPTLTKSYSTVGGSTAPRINETTYEHNTSNWILGLPKTIKVSGTLTTENTYSHLGQKTEQRDYGVKVAEMTYYPAGSDQAGALHTSKDALGRTMTYADYMRGNPKNITNPDGTSTSTNVDVNGWAKSSTDASGDMTEFTHDSTGRVVSVTPPGGFSMTSINHDYSSGSLVQTTKKGNSETQVTHDAKSRPVLEKSTDLVTGWVSYVKTEYDTSNRVSFKSYPSDNPNPTIGTRTTYDDMGRIYNVTTPDGTTKHRYFTNNRIDITTPDGKITRTYHFAYDGPDSQDPRLIIERQNNSDLRRTNIYKNNWGAITQIRQYGNLGGQSVDERQYFAYDSRRRLCRHRTAEGGDTVFKYDNANQVIQQAKGLPAGGCVSLAGNANRVVMTYDEQGRIKNTLFDDPSTPDIRRYYDAKGNLKQIRRGAGANLVQWIYRYDEMNQIDLEILRYDGKRYQINNTFNADGHLTRKRLPSGKWILYYPDGMGRSTRVRYGLGSSYTDLANSISRHPDGQVEGFTYGNGLSYNKQLDSMLRAQSMSVTSGSNTAINYQYAYNNIGLISNIVDNRDANYNQSYLYDGLKQLKQANGVWGQANYSYDSLGNILSKNYTSYPTIGARNLAMTYDSDNRLSSYTDNGSSGNKTLAYDSRGNVTTLGALEMVYDVSDQAVSLSGSSTGSYVYDGNNRRVKSEIDGNIIYSVYDSSGSLVHVDEVTAGTTTDYVMSAGLSIARIDNEDGITYLHIDHQGSSSTTSDINGVIGSIQRNSPFGESLPGATDAFHDDHASYTGHVRDVATSLNYMQARYQDPITGRFLSIDPVDFDSSMNTGMFNRYSYTLNDPINKTDPDGRYACVITPPTPVCISGAASAAPIAGALFVTGAGALAAATTEIADPARRYKTHATYTLINDRGQIYIGRTSGLADPVTLVTIRFSTHHRRLPAFGSFHSPMLDRFLVGQDAYAAIRGREQNMIDAYGGVGNHSVGNAINGISALNPRRAEYLSASQRHFGTAVPYR